MEYRIGQGFDAHKFAKGRPLILGGIQIQHDFGLEGHSDADVLTHAIIDSILGALSLGNIGICFPDTDLSYKNADSMKLLRQVLDDENVRNWKIVNIDSTIIAQKPKLNPHLDNIKSNLSNALSIPGSCISVKPKTTEGMGFCGREEGIAVLVNILLKKN